MKTVGVTDLNNYIRDRLEGDPELARVYVRGELSNVKRHSSGHAYFSMKDEGGAIRCVMFRSAMSGLRFTPEDGQKVIARGRIGVYTRNGAYQLYVDAMMPDGLGDLRLRYEALKTKLEAEGVFKSAAERRPLPPYPKKIGLVTSRTGAVIRDMVTVMRRRYPGIDLLLAPALVQGEGGAASICAALDALYQREDLDLIIVARGGGSMEDLWCFNEEPVVRKIAQSPIPIISAVGHETDVTLADFAADLRAGTPSIAAEVAVPERRELLQRIEQGEAHLARGLVRIVQTARLQLEKRVEGSIFERPADLLRAYWQRLDEASMDAERLMDRLLERKHRDLAERLRPLEALNPVAVMARGFAVCENEAGHILSDAREARLGETLHVRLGQGALRATVSEIEKDENHE